MQMWWNIPIWHAMVRTQHATKLNKQQGMNNISKKNGATVNSTNSTNTICFSIAMHFQSIPNIRELWETKQ